jgi:hypothetical protein
MSDDDETLILKYLSGFLSTETGRPSTEYLKPGGTEELAARAALARRLRSIDAFSEIDPLTSNIRLALASLFATDEFPDERMIKIKRARRRGSPKNLDLTIAIGDFLLKRTRGKDPEKFESVVKEAQDKFGLKRRAIFKAWALCRYLEAAD